MTGPLRFNGRTKDLIALTAILLVSIWACGPLFQNAVPTTHDYVNVVLKHISLKDYFGRGQLLPRWVPDYYFGYGYPSFNFYPPLFSIISVLIDLVVRKMALAINLASFVVVLSSGWAAYLLGKELWGRTGAVLCGTAYVLAPYHMVDLYVRGALAELTAFIFLPLILWAILKLRTERSTSAFLTLALSVAGLLLSHNVISIFFLPIAVLYALAQYLPAEGRKNWKLALSAFFLGLLITAFFWLPAMAEKKFVNAQELFGGPNGYYHYAQHFLYLQQLWACAWNYGGEFIGIKDDAMKLEIGRWHLLLAAISSLSALIFAARQKKYQLVLILAILLTSAFMMLEISRPVWDRIPILLYAQFPWRWLTVAAFAASMLTGALCLILPKWARITFVSVGIALLLAGNIRDCRPHSTKRLDDLEKPLAIRTIQPMDIREYIPKKVKIYDPTPLPEPLTVLNGEATISGHTIRNPIHHLFTLDARTTARVRFSNYDFPGWTVLADGERIPLLDNDRGLIEFEIAPGRHAVELVFRSTMIRRTAEAVSLIGLALLTFLTMRLSRRERKGTRTYLR